VLVAVLLLSRFGLVSAVVKQSGFWSFIGSSMFLFLLLMFVLCFVPVICWIGT